MKIATILPGPSQKPIGGFKIIYQYCDLLIQSSQDVEVDFYYILDKAKKDKIPLKTFLKAKYIQYINPNFWRWFEFSSKKNISHIIGLDKDVLKNYDVIIATSLQTAYILKDLKLKVPVIYFIQHFENWTLKDSLVYNSYKMGYNNIVVSKWLKDLVLKSGAPVALHLPNPVDDIFDIHIQLESRPIKSILFMYHPRKWKGSTKALEALNIVKQQYDDVIVSCFSAYKKPKDFPHWIKYHHLPTRGKIMKLMNEHFIFLHTSYSEGYGLPPAEAMASGSCIVTTDCGGVNDFAIKDETAYIVSAPPKPYEITNTIFDIFNNPEKARFLAKNGYKKIKQINWMDNLNKFSSLIFEIINDKSKS